MSKYINLTEDVFEKIIEDVRQKLKSDKMTSGTFNYSYKIDEVKEDERPKLIFTSNAYIKMKWLVDSFTSEVGWQGLVEKTGDREYKVTDIIVYPQTVTGSTVNTDEKEFARWISGLEEETFNRLRFHGHSHVNFGVVASLTDMDHRKSIISQLGKEDYYIFMIINKKSEFSVVIYDMVQNKLFETGDIDVFVESVNQTESDFIKYANGLVKTQTYVYVEPKKEKPKKKNQEAKYEQLDIFDDFEEYPKPNDPRFYRQYKRY